MRTARRLNVRRLNVRRLIVLVAAVAAGAGSAGCAARATTTDDAASAPPRPAPPTTRVTTESPPAAAARPRHAPTVSTSTSTSTGTGDAESSRRAGSSKAGSSKKAKTRRADAAAATTTTVPAPGAGSDVYVPTAWPPFTPAGPLDGIAALTGAPAAPEVTGRAVLAVKVDNAPRARPQWNLDLADVIFEENVEGVTRFIALFHSRLPADVGPVRSSRTSDLSILAALNRPILAWSGGNSAVTAEVRSAADAGVIVDVSALRVGCYRREPSRRAPHNLVLDPACVHARAAGAPARPLWPFDPAWHPGAAAYGPDTTFEVPMDGVRVSWQWDPVAGRYLRSQDGTPHLAASGNVITVDNVVTMYVAHVASRADGRSPEAVTVGSGQVMVHRDGIATAGTWERAGPYEPFTFRDTNGNLIALRPGTTFVHLARGA